MLTKEQKKQIVKDLADDLTQSSAVVFTNYQGLKVNDLQDLRGKLRDKKIKYKVVKNTLLKLALDDNGFEIEGAILDKPLAIAISYDDEVAPAKILNEYSRTKKNLEVLGGLINQKYFGISQIKALANLPSREVLYAQVVGSIKAPLSGFVNVLGGNLRGLVSVLKQYHSQKSNG